MLLRTLSRMMAPPTCLGCGREGQIVCHVCYQRLTDPPPPACFRCSKNNDSNATCVSCRPFTALAGVTTAATYGGIMRELVHWLKYRRLGDAALPLAAALTPLLDPTHYDVVTVVPVATVRLRSRGYNQSELIARHLATRLQLPYRRLLRRCRNTQQVGKGRAERLEQVTGSFAATHRLTGQRVLLIDDVLTTGATLHECAIQLHNAGAAKVWAAAPVRD